MKTKIYILLIALFTPFALKAQVPTVQDCLGAIPICQNIYTTNTSYFGMGNYSDEIPWSDCLYLCGESNSVWYIFTVQSSGNFSFILTPNNINDDYDWAVFNITNASCSDLYYNFSGLLTSCNAASYTGQTGISIAMGGSVNSNPPGYTNAFNADLPVQAGETYVIMLSNWTGGSLGYTIDFSSSTAQIFDNVPPKIQQITSNISVGNTSLTFNFSENILCSSIAPCDLTLTGPGGPYTITNLSGNGCSVGGNQEKTFTITFNPPIISMGNYTLKINPSTCNSVTDLCGNVASKDSINMVFSGISEIIQLNKIQIYPNPGTGIFTISMDGVNIKDMNCTVSTAIGQSVYKGIMTGNTTMIDLSSVAKGVYFLNLKNDNINRVAKIIVE